MKIAIVQINATVGDLAGNSKKIQDSYQQAGDAGAELVIYPEMVVTGYPPLDLLYRKRFVLEAEQAARELIGKFTGPPAILGCVLPNSGLEGRPVFNAAMVSDQGKIHSVHIKTRLPTYNVYNEDRYFEPATSRTPVQVAGIKLGVTICEDIWPGPDLNRHRYRVDPVEDLKKQGIDLLVNISASPYNQGKIKEREELLTGISNRIKCPVVMVNMVGGNDSLLFDGTSLAVYPGRGVVARAKAFEEDTVFIDLAKQTGQLREVPSHTEAELCQAICMGLRDYVRKCGFDSVALGLSGGIDSAVCAVLAAQALGPQQVLALAMPSEYSAPQSWLDAEQLAKNLGIRLASVPIKQTVEAFRNTLSPLLGDITTTLTEENLQARIRGVLEMAFANQKHLVVLATGNKSELAVGYCTLYGDMVGGIAPIGDLTKTQVYRLARYINRNQEVIPASIIERAPSAELRPGQIDQDRLPAYDLLDAILELFIEEELDEPDIVQKGYPPETVSRVIQMVERSEYKRHQSAIVLRVNRRAFGAGRQIPLARYMIQGH